MTLPEKRDDVSLKPETESCLEWMSEWEWDGVEMFPVWTPETPLKLTLGSLLRFRL